MTAEEKKIMAGILFCPGDPELRALKLKAHNLNQDYNQLYEDQTVQRQAILEDLLGWNAENQYVQRKWARAIFTNET